MHHRSSRARLFACAFGLALVVLGASGCTLVGAGAGGLTASGTKDPDDTSKDVAIGAAVGAAIDVIVLLVLLKGASFGYGAWGRPLRVRGREVHPGVQTGTAWAQGRAPDVSALDDTHRRALAGWWLRDAQKEHASVPAFAKLAWQLSALGAPAELLERTYRAGLQEIDHARRCFALVSAYAGQPCGAMPMPELHHDNVATTLAQLARDSLVDGCFIEDLNSDAAELARSRATDLAVHELCDIVARDERAHAQLAWDLVAWCIEAGGDDVRAALTKAAAGLPAEGSGLYDDELAALVDRCDLATLHAHGRVPLTDWPGLYRTRLAATRARLATMLAEEPVRASA